MKFRKTLSRSAIACSLAITSGLMANPSGATVVSGSVVFDQSQPGVLNVIIGSDRTIIDWDDFSLDVNDVTNFQMSDTSFSVLNRVTGSSASSILGDINSNAVVYVVNPQGVLIGPDAVISTKTFLASTLDATNSQFLSGLDMTFAGSSGNSVVNYGNIAAQNGDAVILGYRFYNSGTISASSGNINAGMGTEIVLHPLSNNSIDITLHSSSNSDGTGFENLGTMQAVTIAAKADGAYYSTAISQGGYQNATGSQSQNGIVILRADGGSTNVTGVTTASNPNNTGGTVQILGKYVNINDNATIDCSGQEGGGFVFVGGSFQGSDPSMINAQQTMMSSSATINNNATYFNNGGQVVVWADDSTNFYGTIHALGGTYSGDGGLVEVSGLNYLNFAGTVDNSAPQGNQGILIQDPLILEMKPMHH